MSESNTVPFTQTVFTWIKLAIADALSIPLRVENHLNDHPELRADLPQLGHVISHETSFVRWDMWSEFNRDDIHYWQREDSRYRCKHIHSPELNNLVTKEKIENWSCDISEVDCVLSSKSNLREFATLDDMVETNSRSYIDAITEEKLEQNLSHGEIRIIHRKDIDYFVRYAWDGRLYLANNGGSHHFAAARYIAKRLPRKVPLTGALYIYRLNPISVNSINAKFRMFTVKDDHFFRGFSDVLEAFDCPYGLRDAPRPLNDAKILFLSKDNDRAMRVADVLEKSGYLNLNTFLARQLVRDGA